jgi:SAM-dependent methyltransferase
MPLDELKKNGTISDDDFDAIFPVAYRVHSNRHFTSVYIAQRAITFLESNYAKSILDIGSATGKFCLVGGATTKLNYTGIEYREDQVRIANSCAKKFNLTNVSFKYANILEIQFDQFDGFYMFNPFLENIDLSANMDGIKDNSPKESLQYIQHVKTELSLKPIGTPLVTYWTPVDQIPLSFKLQHSIFGDTLKFWLKVE